MIQEEVEKGLKCCDEFFCDTCPYHKYDSRDYSLRCVHMLIRDINKLYFGREDGEQQNKIYNK